MHLRYIMKLHAIPLTAIICAVCLLILMVSKPPLTRSGDEPHYMLVINSIIFDRDFDLREDYDRVRMGGFEAGSRFFGVSLDD